MNAVTRELPQLHLKPGELLVTRDAFLVITVLGSCVAVTMHNPRLHLAAICHAMLPQPQQDATAQWVDRYKYLSEVIPAMVEYFLVAAVEPWEIEVKLFGGGNVIGPGAAIGERCLGNDNVRLAGELLRSAGLRVKASNVGGVRGRKILFNTATGEVLHKHLGHTEHLRRHS